MIKAVIFDFDGVIGDTMPDNCKAWQKAFQAFDFYMNPTEYYRLEGMGRYQIANHFIVKYNLPVEILEEVVEAKEQNYKNDNNFRLFEGVKEIFNFLKEKNIAIAIVTGASRARITEHLDTKISESVSKIITADDVVNTKPHPEPYLKAVAALGQRADECIVVENALLGIASAKSAGCICYALETTLSRQDLAPADEIFANHRELLNRFRTFFDYNYVH